MLAQRRRYDAAAKSAHHSASMKQRTTLNITPNLESLKETAVAFQTQTRSDDCRPRQRRTAKEARGTAKTRSAFRTAEPRAPQSVSPLVQMLPADGRASPTRALPADGLASSIFCGTANFDSLDCVGAGGSQRLRRCTPARCRASARQ